MEANTTLNSALYEMYKLKKMYGHLIDDMEKVQTMFDNFYNELEKENFEACRQIIKDIAEILGENNPDIIRAKTFLSLEEK